jgi:hypothetical protein
VPTEKGCADRDRRNSLPVPRNRLCAVLQSARWPSRPGYPRRCSKELACPRELSNSPVLAPNSLSQTQRVHVRPRRIEYTYHPGIRQVRILSARPLSTCAVSTCAASNSLPWTRWKRIACGRIHRASLLRRLTWAVPARYAGRILTRPPTLVVVMTTIVVTMLTCRARVPTLE